MAERIGISGQARCLQEKIGSCSGCAIQAIVLEKRAKVCSSDERSLVERVRQIYCPEGNRLLVPSRSKTKIHFVR